ncbi:MAG TPA: phage tail tape measure protein [Chlorobiota bacterium]|nr:phage tail tape measure protein [Chlorobiota bacterium]
MAKVELDISLNPVINAPALNAQLELVRKALGPLGQGIKPIDEAAWKKSLQSAASETQKLGDELDKNRDRAREFEKALKFTATVTAVQQVSSAISGLAAPLIGLDTQVKNIGTLGVEGFEEFRDLALDLSKKVPDSAATIAQGAYNAISAGITGTNEEIIGFVETASKVAVAGVSDTNSAVNGLTSVLNAYKLGAAGAASVSDTFFAAIKLGKTSFNEMNAGLANVVPAASAAKISFAEVSAVIAQMTALGVPTAQATTQVRAAIIELQKPGAQLASVMAGVSVEIDGVTQTLNASNIGKVLEKQGLTKTLQQVEQSAKGMGLTMTQVFSSSEAASAALLTTGDNAARMNLTFQQVQNEIAGGAATKAYEVAATGIAAQTNVILNNVQAFVSSGLGALGDGFLTVTDAAAKLAPTLATVAQLKNILPEGLGKNALDFGKALLQSVVPGLFGQATATTAAGTATKGFNATLAASPIGAIIVAITAAIGVTKLLSDALHETAKEKLEDAQATTAMIQAERESAAARLQEAQARVNASQSYADQVKIVRDAEAAARAEGLTIDERAAKQRAAQEASSLLTQATADLTEQYPGAVSAGKTFEENLTAIQAASLKSSDELIALAGQVYKLDQQLAEAQKIELNLEVQVAAEELEDTLTDVMGNVVSDATDWLFGTSTPRQIGEEFIASFKNDVFNAKTAEEIAAAQSEMISKVKLNAEEMDLDPAAQKQVIDGIKAFAQKRKSELETLKKNDANLTTASEKAISDAFQSAAKAGRDVTTTINSISESFGISKDRARQAAIDGELKKISAEGQITAETVSDIAKRFGQSEAEVKKAAFSTEIRKALDAGVLTAKQVDEIATKYGRTSDEARQLVAEQEKQVAAAKSTQEEVKKIGDAFNETKKAAQEANAQQKADLAALLQQRREARTKEEREQADADIRRIRQDGLKTTKQLKQIEADEKAAAALIGQGEAKKLKSLKDVQDQILQIERDAAQTRAQIAERSIQDETERAIAERQRAATAELRTIDDEIERVRKDKEISAQARQALEVALTDKRNAIIERQEADRADFDVETYAKKTTETLAKKKALEDQATAEEVALRAARITNLEQMDVTAGDVALARVKDLAELRLQELRQANRAELDAIVEKNLAVVRAQEALDKALSEKSSTSAIDAAREALEKAKSAALDTDSVVLEVKKRQLKAETDLEDQNRKEKRAAEIAQITDLSVRKRDLAVFEAEKTLEEARKSAQGNREAELAAEREFQKAKRAIELEYLGETAPFFAAGLAAAQNLQSALAGVYDAGAAEQSAKEEEAHQKRLDQFQAEQDALKARLDAGLLLWEDYQQQIDDLDRQRADAEAERAEKAREEEDKRRAAVADSFRKAADQQADAFIDSAANGETAFEKLAASAAFNFAAIGAAGESFKDQFTGIMLDLVTKSITAYLPQIYAASIGLLGPIVGPLAATTAVAFVLTKLSEARAGIGAEKGVVAITKSYSRAPGATDTIPIMVAEGETITSKEATIRNRRALEHFSRGGDERSYFETHYAAPIRAEVDAKIERLAEAVHEVAASVKSVRDRVMFSARQTSTKISNRDITIALEWYAKLQRAAQ